MRFVNRETVDEPDSLKTPSVAVKAEKDAALIFYRTYDPLAEDAKGYVFVNYNGYDVKAQLKLLFDNKCAYCESDLGDNLDVEHFRPKLGVTEDPAHPGYWWLAHTWSNLLPSCEPCNRLRLQHLITEQTTVEEFSAFLTTKPKQSYGKANQFPIAGARALYNSGKIEDEKPDLIDPTQDDPQPFLKWSRAGHYSVVLARADGAEERKRALTTINAFALNRTNLVRNRTRTLSTLRFQAEKIIEQLGKNMDQGGSQEHINQALVRVEQIRRFQDADQEFTAMVKDFIDEFTQELLSYVAR